jgi:hypothetical protein
VGFTPFAQFLPTSGGTITGNLTVSGTITSQSGAFPAISAPNGSMGSLQFASQGGAAFDAQAIGGGYRTAEGANAKQGVATLVAGTVVVPNTTVTATSRIQLTVQSLGTVVAPSALAVSARTPGTSFTILASQATDTSVVAYEIFEVG